MTILKKTYSADIQKGVEDKQDLYLFVISDGLKDRHGESINPEGWDFTDFNDNPVALVGHDYGSLMVGRWLPPFVENGQVKAYLELADTQRANEVRMLIDGGFLKTVSVGFIAEEYGKDGDVYDINKQKLMEVSLVSIPANTRAQRIKSVEALKSFDAIDAEIERQKVQQEEQQDEQIILKQVITALEQLKETVEELKKNIIVKEKIVEKVITVNGDSVKKNATTLLLEIVKQSKKVDKKQSHISALLTTLTQNVTTSDGGGGKK